VKAIPGKIVRVTALPRCNFCNQPGPYDFVTKQGPWANGCEKCWKEHRRFATLGVGMGQFWFVGDDQ
jgi:hypothetical protein